MNNFFDVEWQEKILLVEIIAFVTLIITAGKFKIALWRRHFYRDSLAPLSNVIQEFFGREIKSRYTGSLNIQLSIAI